MEKNNNNNKNQSFFQQILSHPKLSNFIVYSLSNACFGMMITSLGPINPYLAEAENRSEIEYSILFTCRAIGFLIGALSVHLFEDKLSLHQLLVLGISIMGVCSCFIIFWQSLLVKGTLILVGSIGCAYQDVTINLSALLSFKKDNTAMWLQMIHGFFGIGGLLGPFIVYLFEIHSFTIIGILSICLSVFYYYTSSPEKQKQKQHEPIQQNQRAFPKISIYLSCLSFFFIVGQEAGFAGWVSPYAVLQDFSSKEHATMYSSVYWVSITISRFVLASVKGSDSQKMQILAVIGIINSIVSYFLIFNVSDEFGLIFMAVIFGLSNSSMYALQLTIPSQFGYSVSLKNTINFVIWASLGDGCLAGGIGKLMGWISFNWLIYSMFIIDILILLINIINKKILMKEKDVNCKKKLLEGYEMQVL